MRGGRPEERIVRALDPGAWAGQADRFNDVEPIPDGIIQALRHPVVWGGYAALREVERNGILDGESGCLTRLAEQLLARFLTLQRSGVTRSLLELPVRLEVMPIKLLLASTTERCSLIEANSLQYKDFHLRSCASAAL